MITINSMSHFTGKLGIEQDDIGGNWKTSHQLNYYVGYKDSHDVINVPEGFETDGATIPLFLKIFGCPLRSDTLRPAILHDYLYETRSRTREESDRIFLEAMEVCGVGFTRRTMYYIAVRIFGGIIYYGYTERIKSIIKELWQR